MANQPQTDGEYPVAFLIDEAHRSQEGRMARARSLPFRVEAAFPGCDPILMVAEEPEIGSPGQDEEDAAEVTTAAAHAPGEPDAEDAQDQQDPQDMIARPGDYRTPTEYGFQAVGKGCSIAESR